MRDRLKAILAFFVVLGADFSRPALRSRFTAVAMLALTVAVLIVAVRGEDTRNVIERVDSACARASSIRGTAKDVEECARIRREADRVRPLRDACITFRKAMRPRWFRVTTFCPQKPRRTPPKTGRTGRAETPATANPSKATVVPVKNDPTPATSSRPAARPVTTDPPAAPAPPSTPSKPSRPPTPTTPDPAPSAPVSPTAPAAPRPPLIDLTPVTRPACDLVGSLARLCP